MLKQFRVKNYKNFKDEIVIDFSKVGGYQFNKDCISDHMISKMLIYGRNATGKTNLGSALFDIRSNLSTSRIMHSEGKIYLNADSNEKYAVFEYVFQFQQDEIIYRYKKISEFQLYDEELLLNGERCFYYDFVKKESDFKNLKFIEANTVVVDRYLQMSVDHDDNEFNYTLPFLRWLINNTALSNDSILLKMNAYVKEMVKLTIGAAFYRLRTINRGLFEMFSDRDQLKDFEEFLNAMGVKCQLVLEELPDGQKELYFCFRDKRLVPFLENASSGTLTLLRLYTQLAMGRKESLMYMDELDVFFHHEVSKNIIRFFKEKYPKNQIIMTTHSTNLITNRLMRPDCLFILSRSGKLTALCDATLRELREGHNLEKMYISGEFERYE